MNQTSRVLSGAQTTLDYSPSRELSIQMMSFGVIHAWGMSAGGKWMASSVAFEPLGAEILHPDCCAVLVSYHKL